MNYNLKLSLEIWKRLIFLKQRSKSNILKYYPTEKYINCTLKGGDELEQISAVAGDIVNNGTLI